MGVPPEPIPELDLYAELEVAPTASRETIDAAWRSLVKRVHPDAGHAAADGADADARIRRLNIAHDWLTDAERRARYDRDRALRGTEPWSGTPQASTRAAADVGHAPDWASVRRETHRAAGSSGMSPARSLVASPVLAFALGLLSILVVVAAVLTFSRLAGVGQAPSPSSAAPSSIRTPRPSLPADPAQALAATLPDRVGGIELAGEVATGSEVFGSDGAELAEFLERTGGTADDLIAAYKAGETTDGDFLSLVALRMDPVSGSTLADAFRTTSQQDAEAQVSWSDEAIAGRSVAVSQDAADPRIVAYLVAAADAMYLVITSDRDLAVAAIRSLP